MRRASRFQNIQSFTRHLEFNCTPPVFKIFKSILLMNVWQAAAQILFNNASIWQNAKARQTWLDANADNHDDDYDQVAHWANSFAHPPAAADLKNWFNNLISWQRTQRTGMPSVCA